MHELHKLINSMMICIVCSIFSIEKITIFSMFVHKYNVYVYIFVYKDTISIININICNY